MSSLPRSPFPPVRRVVTGHTLSGSSTIVADTIQATRYWSAESTSGNAIYDLHHTSEPVARVDSEFTSSDGKWVDEIAENKEHVSKDGSVFRVFEFAPGTVTPMHRTVSLDYGVIARGSVTLELDNGERVVLNEGDTVVQRGTMHLWRNESETEWARIYFVVLGAQPLEIGGRKLAEEWRQ
ncbi:Cupin-2 domain-containing protein [Mycena chlorophos]|uniref:Cupin-2 domain-containing protein n=1 Tax=Mycena chlorophos TaxID=658473 RepID=A0A8H6VVU3_MYCCL|nr:Cupin-2 domain-containing protein [Mycena chlorophos]